MQQTKQLHSVLPLHTQIRMSQHPLKMEVFMVMRNQIQNCSGSDSAILGQTGILLVAVLKTCSRAAEAACTRAKSTNSNLFSGTRLSFFLRNLLRAPTVIVVYL